jgi:diguanylate cyclase (GGDEF)-like protein/putative nucleotidyltransferase with HDIG domain
LRRELEATATSEGPVLPSLPHAGGRESSPSFALGARAKLLLLVAAVAAVGALTPALLEFRHHRVDGWLTFAVIGVFVAATQLFPVYTPRNNAFMMTSVFLLAGVFLLPPPLIALLPVVQHLPEWLKARYPWQIVLFNVSNHAFDLLAAWAVADQIHGRWHGNAGWLAAGVAACVVFSWLNHGLLAVMLSWAKHMTIRETGVLSWESVSNEHVLAAIGFAAASFWKTNPWLVPVALAPLLLIRRSLAVEALQEEARVDPKTGLFNARHFASELADELERAKRFDRPLALIMADLDLLREINNSYGHLAGDAVLQGIADIFRSQLRHYDVPARFGGEEFSILLPEATAEQAVETAERIRRAIAEAEFDVETSDEPIRATVSVGVASFPKDGSGANELIHQADLAVYRAKLQGRNRVLSASSEPLVVPAGRSPRLVAVPGEGGYAAASMPPSPYAEAAFERPQLDDEPARTKPHAVHGPRFLALSWRMAAVVAGVALGGIGAGVVGVIWGHSQDWLGMGAVVVLVAIGQALAFEYDDTEGSLSVSAVGALAGAALFGPRAALPLALAIALVEWSARRPYVHQTIFNVGSLSLASLSAAGMFALAGLVGGTAHEVSICMIGIVAGGAYFLANMGTISLALAVEGRDVWARLFRERFAWLLPHYLTFGLIGGVMALAYDSISVFALPVFAVPLLLMRKTQEAYVKHTQKSATKLREAAETIQSQNVSLEKANRLLRERSTAAMESLSATVDARDSYTAGHSRRVQQLALAVGRELGMSEAELDLLGHAALFHDIGKLGIPDAILLKPGSLTPEEWALMQRHAEEGARIIDRLGFLQDAVPSIRHHHERFDGTGYPDGLRGEDIPLGARVIHVADALDSMLTTRIYRAARPANEALEELRRAAGSQFCPRCVAALERILPVEMLEAPGPHAELLGVAS